MYLMKINIGNITKSARNNKVITAQIGKKIMKSPAVNQAMEILREMRDYELVLDI